MCMCGGERRSLTNDTLQHQGLGTVLCLLNTLSSFPSFQTLWLRKSGVFFTTHETFMVVHMPINQNHRFC